jgi:hypothetical protein
MNRSILIVICDFLLLSLLTFSTDINHLAGDDTSHSAGVEVVTNAAVEPARDLVELMKQALADEHKGQEQLQQQLALARSAAGSQQESLTKAEAENARLKQQSASLETQSARWQEQYAVAQTNVENLSRQVRTDAAQARLSAEELAAKEVEARKNSDLASALKQQLDQVTRSNQLAQAEQVRLAGQLQVADAERRAALDRAGLMQQQAQAAQAENVRLAEGFKLLATNSSQLTRELHENRPLAPNTVFSEFVTNRVRTALVASRTGFLGVDLSKDKNAETMLVTDGTNIFAVCHVDDTPLTLWDPGTDWEGLTGKFSGHAAEAAVRSISFHRQDPRVVMFPVDAATARQLGCKIYRLAADPYKFQDAVLIGADSGYYGQCDFQIDLNTPQYVRLDRNLLKGLFGKFNPSRGDVVLSRTGEFLGLMVNSTYCLVINDFGAAATLAFGPNVRAEHTGDTLARLYGNLFQMPLRLQ